MAKRDSIIALWLFLNINRPSLYNTHMWWRRLDSRGWIKIGVFKFPAAPL